MTTTNGFAINERVLCYHGPLVYEAKVLKTETWDEHTTKLGSVGPHYYVHYKGWKQTWDEWVPPPRLLKFSETNLALQKSLQQAQSAASAASSSSKASASAKAAPAARRKEGRGKRAREEDDARRPDLRLTTPEIMKVLLVDDWEAVTKNNQLVTLPRAPTVVEILQEFKAHILAKPPPHLRDPAVLLPTVIAGLQTYFDRALGANLLYRFERPQYAEVRKRFVTGPTVKVGEEKEMSAVYGAEHLLRMIVSLPQMVASSTMDPESVALLRDYVTELIDFMMRERNRIFQIEYESASLQYQNLSRS